MSPPLLAGEGAGGWGGRGPAPQPWGEVYDLGYKHYDGPRLGRAHAMRALTIYSIKRGLGIKKKWTSKIIPILMYLAAYTPAVIVAAILAFAPEGLDFDYYDLNGIIGTVLFIYAAALAPEMLSDDRRENVLQLYFTRALTRLDYLLAKIAALALLMGTIVFGPPLLLYVANVLLANDPIGYLFDHLDDLARIAANGVLVSGYLAAIGLAIASYVNRKGVAAAVFIGGFFVITGIANALFNALDSEIRRYIIFISPGDLVEAAGAWIFGRPQESAMADLPGPVYAAAMLAVVAIAAAIMYRRYLAEE